MTLALSRVSSTNLRKKHRFYNSIFIQAALIVIGFTLVSLLLSGYFFLQSMKMVAMKETENKATIFLSAMETSVRRFVMGRDPIRPTELVEERAKLLESNLKFKIVRVVVRDSQGRIIDHTRPEKIGQTTYISDDFQKVITAGRPLIKRHIKAFKLEPGSPEIPVIEVISPVRNRKGDILATIKIILDVRRSFELIHEVYWHFVRRVFIGFALAAFLLILGTLFFLHRRIITPVLSVAEGSARVASGDLEPLLVPRGRDEISNLIQSFNQMVEGLKQRDQMRQSLEIAMEVQQNLLPKNDPNFEGLDIAGKSIYCDETGGDYFDFIEFEYSSGKIGIVVGDVSGHGISSALLMATARAFLRQRSALPGTISQVVSDINRQLARDVVDTGSFMSMFYMIIDKTNKSLKWVRAGHDPAIFYDPNTDKITELKGVGMALGVDENWQYVENEKQNLVNGQIIVLGTDGLWETRNPKGEMLGKEPIYTIIKENANLKAKTILNTIVELLTKFQGNSNVEDDVTLVVIKILSKF